VTIQAFPGWRSAAQRVCRGRCPRLVARRAGPARGRTEALDQFAVVSVQLAALAEQLRPLARLYAARPRAVSTVV